MSVPATQRFRNEVGIRFQLYNSLFTSLPFHRIEKTGILLSLLLTVCEEGYERGKNPTEILEEFFARQTAYATEEERLDMLFRFTQYVERQVVLFDALEDASFGAIHDLNGPGTLKHLESEVKQQNLETVLAEKLKTYGIRLVLTAHPTQFYPGEVLAIIHDLGKALEEDNAALVNSYLQQLGKTPFFKQVKPTPYDEAVSLVWYLENVFYHAAGRILTHLKSAFPQQVQGTNPIIHMGFWPGGDRDGNPFVTVDTTLKVAEALRTGILKCYYSDLRRLRRRLTFKGITQPLVELEQVLYDNVFVPGHRTLISKDDMLLKLHGVLATLQRDHNGLFAHLLESLINKIEIFGSHFASLDIRQDSSVHTALWKQLAAHLPTHFEQMDEAGQLEALAAVKPGEVHLADAVQNDTVETVRAIAYIQRYNGEAGCHRYIISQCNSARNAMEVYALFMLAGYQPENLAVDIVPLFETIDDLQHAAATMKTLYSLPAYRSHLQRRGNMQTIMLGFSDGTKDGGYLMANYAIYKAKEELTTISRHYDIEVLFFDGRGGPPARGGGKTHKFYASMGQNIANREIQLTIQGQTVSSNFGTIDAAQYNMEQLIHAGIHSSLLLSKLSTLDAAEEHLLHQLATLSQQAYLLLKEHPNFVDYLMHASPLRYYADTNIGSRPAKRGSSGKLTLKDLRAIPFVGSWSQLKQNVTGYYGLGTALQKMKDEGHWHALENLYHDCLFFRTLVDNAEMAMKKCFFPLTTFLADHPVYGKVWHMIHDEYELTRSLVLQLGGHRQLMEEYPVDQLSIHMRERIVLPLLTIQQYALTKVRRMEEQVMTSPLKGKYEKLAMRCSFGIINAGRNSA